MIEITAEIRAFIDKAAAGVELAEDEYIDPSDGLIHCKKCGGQRQTVVPCFGKSGYFMPRCICQCQREAEEQRKAAEERQRRMERIKRRKAQGLGNSLITVLPEQLQSPLLTAEWEQQLSGIQKGVCLPDDFLDGICAMLTELIQSYRPVAGADILFPSDEKVIGKCPRCGSKVVERSKGYFCTNRDCKFVLWRDSRFFTLKQKTLDRKTAAKLLEKGKAPLKGCVSPRTGQVYDATVLLEDDGTRPSFRLVFGNG